MIAGERLYDMSAKRRQRRGPDGRRARRPWDRDRACRNLLDFYREPDSRVIQAAKANVDADAEEELAFESYRDLVRCAGAGCVASTPGAGRLNAPRLPFRRRLLQQKVSDEEGIEQAEKVNVDMRFRVQSLAAKAHGLTLPGMGPGSASQGQFSAVPMDYGRGGDDVDDADAAPVQVGAEGDLGWEII